MRLVVQYSFSLTTFSPSGKLVQIEYALKAVAGGATSLGIKATNGVVIATERKMRTSLIDESTVQKISLLTPNIGVAYSGMGPDSRVLVRKARKQAQVRHTISLTRTRLELLSTSLHDAIWHLIHMFCRHTTGTSRNTSQSHSSAERPLPSCRSSHVR